MSLCHKCKAKPAQFHCGGACAKNTLYCSQICANAHFAKHSLVCIEGSAVKRDRSPAVTAEDFYATILELVQMEYFDKARLEQPDMQSIYIMAGKKLGIDTERMLELTEEDTEDRRITQRVLATSIAVYFQQIIDAYFKAKLVLSPTKRSYEDIMEKTSEILSREQGRSIVIGFPRKAFDVQELTLFFRKLDQQSSLLQYYLKKKAQMKKLK